MKTLSLLRLKFWYIFPIVIIACVMLGLMSQTSAMSPGPPEKSSPDQSAVMSSSNTVDLDMVSNNSSELDSGDTTNVSDSDLSTVVMKSNADGIKKVTDLSIVTGDVLESESVKSKSSSSIDSSVKKIPLDVDSIFDGIIGSGTDPPTETIYINIGDTIEFKATGLTISSENSEVVSVTNTGAIKKITAVSPGTVDIKGTVVLSSGTLFQVQVGEMPQYSGEVGSSIQIIVEDGVKDWSSSDISIASISNVTDNIATVQCNNIGSAVITYNYLRSFKVPGVLTRAQITSLNLTIKSRFNVKVTIPVFDLSIGDTIVFDTSSLTISSLDDETNPVLSVASAEGNKKIITAMRSGIVDIEGTVGGSSAILFQIEVSEYRPYYSCVIESSFQIIGKTGADWVIDDMSIVTISDTSDNVATVQCNKIGSTVITCKYDGCCRNVSATVGLDIPFTVTEGFNVKVTAPEFKQSTGEIYSGGGVTTLSLDYQGASPVTWTVSDESIVKIVSDTHVEESAPQEEVQESSAPKLLRSAPRLMAASKSADGESSTGMLRASGSESTEQDSESEPYVTTGNNTVTLQAQGNEGTAYVTAQTNIGGQTLRSTVPLRSENVVVRLEPTNQNVEGYILAGEISNIYGENESEKIQIYWNSNKWYTDEAHEIQYNGTTYYVKYNNAYSEVAMYGEVDGTKTQIYWNGSNWYYNTTRQYTGSNYYVNVNNVPFTLIVEGLGTSPTDNQISSITFASSDAAVVDVLGSIRSADGSSYPLQSESPTGLQYEVTALAKSIGSAIITVTVTGNNTEYTRSSAVVVSGIVLKPKRSDPDEPDVILEVGEACVLFAERYGFDKDQAGRDLTWVKDPNSNWITINNHGTGRQKEAYYVKGNSVGTGTVTVSLKNGNTVVYSDTVNVEVVSKKSVIIQQGGTEVTTPIDLSGTISSVNLNAVLIGFTDAATVGWKSSDSNLVEVSQAIGDSVIVGRQNFSDDIVAITVTATEGDIVRRKTVYVTVKSSAPSLKITSAKLTVDNSGATPQKNITLAEGETVTLSAQFANAPDNLIETATIWSATTDNNGRVPVKLNSTVGKNITITGRLSTSAQIVITASNKFLQDETVTTLTDKVYVTVTSSGAKSVKITSTALGADGVIVLPPSPSGDPPSTADLGVELVGFLTDELNSVSYNWAAYIANNSENNDPRNSDRLTTLISLNSPTVMTTTITANTASPDFARVKVTVTIDGTAYTDEILVKYTGYNIIDTARHITIYQGDSVTLQTSHGNNTNWGSHSQKTYFGASSQQTTYVENSSMATLKTLIKSGATTNPSRIIANSTEKSITEGDSVYVFVAADQRWTVTFDLNRGYGTTPDTVVLSPGDTLKSVVLKKPDAHYPSDDGKYVFYGWSEYSDAADPTTNRTIYLPDQTYTMPLTKREVILYAIWTKKYEDALFVIRLTNDIGAEPVSHDVSEYAPSGIFIRDVLNPAGFYFNVNGVNSHLVTSKLPSDADIVRALSLKYDDGGSPISYDPDNDKVIWYVIKRIANDDAGLPNWHVDGVLVRGSKVSLTYESNISVANLENTINPPCSFYDVGDQVNISNKIPTCRDYYFIGWNTKPDGTGQWYTYKGSLYQGFSPSSGGSVLKTIEIFEDTTLYAIWTGINLRKVWSDNGVHPEEVCVVFRGEEYILSDNNNWTIQVFASESSSSEDPIEVSIPGYMSFVSPPQIMTGSNNIKSVIYTITNTLSTTIGITGGDGDHAAGGNVTSQMTNRIQSTTGVDGSDGDKVPEVNIISLMTNRPQSMTSVDGSDGDKVPEASINSQIINSIHNTMGIFGEDGDQTNEANVESSIRNIISSIAVTITVTSEPANGEYYVLGEEITYEIKVTNGENVTLTDVVMKDALTGTIYSVGTLKPGDSSKPIRVKHTVTEADIIAGKVVNVTTATGKDPDGKAVDEISDKVISPVDMVREHLVETLVEVSHPANGEYYVLGEEIIYEIKVTNDGNVTLTDVVVTDALTGMQWTIEVIKPGESRIFEVSHIVTEDDVKAGIVINVATAKGKDPTGKDVFATSGIVTVKVQGENGHEVTPVPSSVVKTSDAFDMQIMLLMMLLCMVSGYMLFISKYRCKRYR